MADRIDHHMSRIRYMRVLYLGVTGVQREYIEGRINFEEFEQMITLAVEDDERTTAIR